ncbi:unnamed protein product [Caenorhabditis nigoni]
MKLKTIDAQGNGINSSLFQLIQSRFVSNHRLTILVSGPKPVRLILFGKKKKYMVDQSGRSYSIPKDSGRRCSVDEAPGVLNHQKLKRSN